MESAPPTVHETATVAPTAVLCGDVTLGAHSRVLFGAVLTAEGGPVVVGDHCIVRAYEPQAAQQWVELSSEVDPELPLALVDPERIRQVLGNLLSNALRHTDAGGTVSLTATQAGPVTLLLEVTDTGAGIQPEGLPHIFNHFYRGDKARTDGQDESGPGLAIVRSLVTMHEDTITVESAPGRGTSFAIRLPL